MRREKYRTPLAVLLGLLTWGGVAFAEAQASDTNFTLAVIVEMAKRDNADLKSLRAKWEAMRERTLQAGALPANPMLTYGGMDTAKGGSWPDTAEKRIMVQQEFPWLGKRALREGMAARDAEVMQRDLEAMTRDVVMMVKESYFGLYAVQRVIAITREEESVLRRVEKIAETMYATGQRAQVDVIKARAEITMLKQKLLEQQGQEAALKAKLNMLLSRRADSPMGEASLPPEREYAESMEVLLALAATNRPEIKAAQAQVERSEFEKRLMEKESLPDYKVGVEYRDIGAGDDMIMFTVGVDLPVWRSKIGAGIREAAKMRVAGEAARDAVQQKVALDVQEALFKLQTARHTLALYRGELLPQAEARLAASEAGYRTGQVDFLDLLESQRFLLSVRIMATMAEGDVGMQLARLERAVGGDLISTVNAEVVNP